MLCWSFACGFCAIVGVGVTERLLHKQINTGGG